MNQNENGTMDLPNTIGSLGATMQLESSSDNQENMAVLAHIYRCHGSSEGDYLAVIESSQAQPSIAHGIEQGMISNPIDWEVLLSTWTDEHTRIGIFATLDEAKSRCKEWRSDPTCQKIR